MSLRIHKKMKKKCDSLSKKINFYFVRPTRDESMLRSVWKVVLASFVSCGSWACSVIITIYHLPSTICHLPSSIYHALLKCHTARKSIACLLYGYQLALQSTRYSPPSISGDLDSDMLILEQNPVIY